MENKTYIPAQLNEMIKLLEGSMQLIRSINARDILDSREVAKQGLCLDMLSNDTDVIKTVCEKIRECYNCEKVQSDEGMSKQTDNTDGEQIKSPVFENFLKRSPDGKSLTLTIDGASKLINSLDIDDRIQLARLGHCLDISMHDPNEFVRAMVAAQDYRPDVFVNDPSPSVRMVVAQLGHHLDILIKDEHPLVRKFAIDRKMKEDGTHPLSNNQSIDEGDTSMEMSKTEDIQTASSVIENFLETASDDDKHSAYLKIINSIFPNVTQVKISYGEGEDERGWDGFTKYQSTDDAQDDKSSEETDSDDDKDITSVMGSFFKSLDTTSLLGGLPPSFVYDLLLMGLDEQSDEDTSPVIMELENGDHVPIVFDNSTGHYSKGLVNHPSWEVRKYLAEHGDSLDVLISDPDWRVRKAVAEQEYGLGVLVRDVNKSVRAAVADSGFFHTRLVRDKAWYVRAAVARNGGELETLVKDPNWKVRKEVAKYGFGLDQLIKDPHHGVRREVARQDFMLSELLHDEDERVRNEAIKRIDLMRESIIRGDHTAGGEIMRIACCFYTSIDNGMGGEWCSDKYPIYVSMEEGIKLGLTLDEETMVVSGEVMVSRGSFLGANMINRKAVVNDLYKNSNVITNIDQCLSLGLDYPIDVVCIQPMVK